MLSVQQRVPKQSRFGCNFGLYATIFSPHRCPRTIEDSAFACALCFFVRVVKMWKTYKWTRFGGGRKGSRAPPRCRRSIYAFAFACVLRFFLNCAHDHDFLCSPSSGRDRGDPRRSLLGVSEGVKSHAAIGLYTFSTAHPGAPTAKPPHDAEFAS